MTQSTALTPKDQAKVTADKALATVDGSQEWRDIMAMGKVMAMSGMFPDIRDQAQAVVKILAGKELGFGPIYSMTKISIVKGKVATSSEMMGAAIKRSRRYDYQVAKLDDNECVLRFTDRERPNYFYDSRWTMEDSKRASLIRPDSTWEKFPRAMLVARALSQGARIVCPEVIAGVYTYEDFGIETTADGEPDRKQIKIINEQSSDAARPEVVSLPQAGPPSDSQGPVNPPSTESKPNTLPAPGSTIPRMPSQDESTKFWGWARQNGYTPENIGKALGKPIEVTLKEGWKFSEIRRFCELLLDGRLPEDARKLARGTSEDLK